MWPLVCYASRVGIVDSGGHSWGFLTLLLPWRAPEGVCLVPADRLKGQMGSRPLSDWVALWSLPSAALEHVTRPGVPRALQTTNAAHLLQLH